MNYLNCIDALIIAMRRDDTTTTARLLSELDAHMAPEEIGALIEAIVAAEPALFDRVAQAKPPRVLCA